MGCAILQTLSTRGTLKASGRRPEYAPGFLIGDWQDH